MPWDYDFVGEQADGVVISNGPGDPSTVGATIENIRRALDRGMPTLGICMGHQLLARAVGAETFKLKYGHRSQNQPVMDHATNRCYITSQNHGYAVDGSTLPEGWREWFTNANDGTNEGIRHDWKPARSVQFHPEAAPGPVDTAFLFDEFLSQVRRP